MSSYISLVALSYQRQDERASAKVTTPRRTGPHEIIRSNESSADLVLPLPGDLRLASSRTGHDYGGGHGDDRDGSDRGPRADAFGRRCELPIATMRTPPSPAAADPHSRYNSGRSDWAARHPNRIPELYRSPIISHDACDSAVRRPAPRSSRSVRFWYGWAHDPSWRSLGGLSLVSPPHLGDRSAEPEDGAVREQLVTRLLPVLAKKPQEKFNVFDVMRYGGHERQLSDVFAWLLDADGTHKLGDTFLRIFIDVVNRGIGGADLVAHGAYGERQEG